MASGNPLHCVILNPELIDYFILHLKTIWLVQLLEIRKTKKTPTMHEESSQNHTRNGCSCLFTAFLYPTNLNPRE